MPPQLLWVKKSATMQDLHREVFASVEHVARKVSQTEDCKFDTCMRGVTEGKHEGKKQGSNDFNSDDMLYQLEFIKPAPE
mmetsp:Transcript_8465/g.11664  ORF Transcript_8465/g.11664 Transcript_8465/m.11664 type:complete len:80 (+) Transcript_8465:1152-1391(+)